MSVHVKYGFKLKAFAISPLDLLLSFFFLNFQCFYLVKFLSIIASFKSYPLKITI
jgi:hypothetical protein